MIKMIKKPKEVIPTEEQEQIKFVVWLNKQRIRHYAIPNGGRRDMLSAVKLKRCGVSAGVPDICIPLSSYPYHGLYIELKRMKGGVVSESQADWLEYLNQAGYYAVVANGCEEAKSITLKYLSFTPKAA